MGGAGVLIVRPTAVRICAPDAATAHLVGAVADTAFRGRHYELVVDLPGGKRLTGVVVDLPGGKRLTGVVAERRVDRGTAVGIQLDAAGCIVFRPAAAAAPVAGPAAGVARGAEVAGARGSRPLAGGDTGAVGAHA